MKIEATGTLHTAIWCPLCVSLHYTAFPLSHNKKSPVDCQLHSSNMHPCWLTFDNVSGLLTFQWHIAGGWISATKGISSSCATRISVANKELKKFKIRTDDLCAQWKNPDSLQHTFLQCPTNVKFYHEILSKFNVSQNTSTNLFPEKILLQNYILGRTNDNLWRRLDLLILFINIVVKLMTCPLTVHNCK